MKSVGGLAVVGLVLLASCSGGEPSVSVEPVPYPELSGLEEQVRERLQAERQALERLEQRTDLDAAARADAYGRAGMLYHAYSLRDAAAAAYSNACQLAPEEFRWVYYLGRLERARGNPTESIARLERAAELRPDYLPAWIELGRVEFDQNRHDRAQTLFERALALDAGSAAALIGLGKIASARGEFEAAVERLEAALRIAPEASEIRYPLGLAYRGLGQLEQAELHMSQRGSRGAPVNDPLMAELAGLAGGWRLHQRRGTDLFREGMFARALDEFRQAAAAAPEEAIVQVNLGSTLSRLGDTDAAMEAFRRAVELDPGQAMAHFNLGTLAAQGGDDAAAVEHYRAALDADPEMYEAHFNLGNALRRTGDHVTAAEHFRQVRDADPANAIAWLAEAMTHVAREDWSAARETLELGRQAVPDDEPLRMALARVLAAAPAADVRDGDRAFALAAGLIAGRNSLDHVITYAMAAAESGDWELAVDTQSKAIAAVERAGRAELLPALREDLEGYRQQQACRRPWRPEDPLVNP